MEILLKVGNRRYTDDPLFAYDWRDGAVMDIRPNGFYIDKNSKPTGTQMLKSYCVIQTPHDWWDLIGASAYKENWYEVKTNPTFALSDRRKDLLKYTVFHDYQGRCPWEDGFLCPRFVDTETKVRKADWFVDFKRLLDQKWIDQKTYESIYDKYADHQLVYVDRDLSEYIFHEDTKSRLIGDIKNMAYSSGNKTIGSGGLQDYTTWKAAIDAIDATMTGDIELKGNTTEEIADGRFDIDMDTNGHKLTLTVDDDHVHNGGAYGNGHRVLFGTYEYVFVGNDIDDIVIEKLAISSNCASGYGYGVSFGSNSGCATLGLVQRCVMKGTSSGRSGVAFAYLQEHVIVRNNIIYDFSNDPNGHGIRSNAEYYSERDYQIYNNTVVDCFIGIADRASTVAGTITVKNNLCYSNGTDYYEEDGFTNTSKNVSSDATSPDGATYQNWAGSSAFKDAASDDYRLDATDSVLDDGDNLYGSGVTEDVQGQARDNGTPFWIGASHLAAGGTTVNAGLSTLTLTPQASTVSFPGAVSAGLSTLNLTPRAATVSFAGTVSAGLSTLALTPLAAVVSFPAAVSAGVSALAITPLAASVNLGAVTVQAGLSTLSLTPQAATISFPGTVSAGLSTLAITPQPAVVSFPAAVSAGVSGLTLTPLAAEISFPGTVSAGLSALAITPRAATVSFPAAVAAGLSTLSLTPLAATVVVIGEVTVQAGLSALTMTPLAARIVTAYGEITIAFDSAAPAVSFDSAAPAISFGSAAPAITFN